MDEGIEKRVKTCESPLKIQSMPLSAPVNP